MATTAIFAEILVIGIWCLTWIALAIASLTDPDLGSEVFLKEHAAVIGVVVLAYAYSAGIVVDRIADSLWRTGIGFLKTLRRLSKAKPVSSNTKKAKSRSAGEKVRTMRNVVRHQSEGLTSFLDYVRSRLRIARSLSFNAPLAGYFAYQWHASTHVDAYKDPLLTVTYVLAGLAVASWYATFQIGRAYDRNLANAYKTTLRYAKPQKDEPDPTGISDQNDET
ncbi:MAG: hypothetical protein IH849_10420 [Acidobacteria bacterium]|nr:hypothetical protein [Acidobacteriota bacterium]